MKLSLRYLALQEKVEEMIRKIPYSAEKVQIRDAILHWKVHARCIRGGIVDADAIERRKDLHKINELGEKTLV